MFVKFGGNHFHCNEQILDVHCVSETRNSLKKFYPFMPPGFAIKIFHSSSSHALLSTRNVETGKLVYVLLMKVVWDEKR